LCALKLFQYSVILSEIPRIYELPLALSFSVLIFPCIFVLNTTEHWRKRTALHTVEAQFLQLHMTPHYHQQLMVKGLRQWRRCMEERKNKQAVIQVCVMHCVLLFCLLGVSEHFFLIQLDCYHTYTLHSMRSTTHTPPSSDAHCAHYTPTPTILHIPHTRRPISTGTTNTERCKGLW